MKGIRAILCLALILLALPLSACGEKEKAPASLPEGFEEAKVPNTYLDGYLYLNQGSPFYPGQSSIFTPQERVNQAAFLLTPWEDGEALWLNFDGADTWEYAQSSLQVAPGKDAVLLKDGYPNEWDLIQRLPSNPPNRIIGAGFLKKNANVENWLLETTQDPETVEQFTGMLEQARIDQIAIGLYSQNDLETFDLERMGNDGMSILMVGKSSYSGILLSPLLSLFGPKEDKIGETTVYTTNLGDLNIVIKNVGSYVYISGSPDINDAKSLLASALNQETFTEYQKRQLAEKYAPILYMHPDEEYWPKDVRVMIENAELKIKQWMTTIPLDQPLTSLDLYNISQREKSEDLYLDIKGINLVEFEGKEFQGARAYLKKYREIKDNYPTTVYAHVFTYGGKTIIQYWLFYFFNDGPNNHEGDWEYVQINLNGTNLSEVLNSGTPELAVYSQHQNEGEKKWAEVITASNHPLVYVARGSHANYFASDDATNADSVSGGGKIIYPPMKQKKEGRENYGLVILPDLKEKDRIRQEHPWLTFKGDWGEWLTYIGEIGVNGPSGPNTRGEWEKPVLK